MFRIYLKLVGDAPSGIKALDLCRAMKFNSENTSLCIGSKEETSCEVDETFARAWFHPEQTYSTVTIPLAMVAPGDLVLQCQSLKWALAMSGERMRELYVAARFRAERNKADRLTRMNNAMQESLTETNPNYAPPDSTEPDDE